MVYFFFFFVIIVASTDMEGIEYGKTGKNDKDGI